MGKIQKIREQKKIDAEIEAQERRQRIRSIVIGVVSGLVVLFLLTFSIIKFLSWRLSQGAAVSEKIPTPSASVKTESIFPSFSPSVENKNTDNLSAKIIVIETARGNIKLELYPAAAPKTVANFIGLINKNFYNGLTFHRVVPGFVIQGGDPKGDGTGGPGYTFEDEINPWSLGVNEQTIKSYEAQGYQYDKNLTSYKMDVGALAMANSGPNTNGSQFFIVTDSAQPYLDGKHTVFGKVIEGMDAVRKIQQGDLMNKVIIIK